MIKPRTPPGVMELLPRDQIAFQRMLDRIRQTFERFGFLPIETPVFELSEVLLTKSGGETERQVYFAQSTGALERSASELLEKYRRDDGSYEFPAVSPVDIKKESISAREPERFKQDQLPELALRFDLTVPLARYVAEHEHELAFPFRRYQMQRVYRGERQQRGRFREFYQCDIDVVGKDVLSLQFDAEMPAVIHSVFSELAIGKFTIHLNNRKLMRGFLEMQGITESELQARVLREVDKIDKRGAEDVLQTLSGAAFGLTSDVVYRILRLVAMRSNSHVDAIAKLDTLCNADLVNDMLREGISELRAVLELMRSFGVPETDYALNFSIARGLDYYTGTVYETTLDKYPQIGSICSGGRYDNLASHYTKSKLPGVGISIGLTRLFWQLREAGLIATADSSVDVLVTLMRDEDLDHALAVSQRLRAAGLNVETQLESRKLAKQLQYADRAGIRFVTIRGEDEIARGMVAVKDLRRGEQFEVAEDELASTLLVEREQSRALAGR